MRVFLLALVILLFSSACSADVVYLKDGSRVTGEVLSMDETQVKVALPYGTLAVNRRDVLRIDLGEGTQPPSQPEPSDTEPREEKEPVKPETLQEPAPSLQLPTLDAEPRNRKNPRSAAMLAVIPGGGYGYLERWDLAFAAAGVEVGLAALGMSMVNDEGEGKNSTGYIVLGFAGLLKIAEILDSHDRAVKWNEALDSETGHILIPGSAYRF